ncbi:MAG: hypothetical protein ABSB52_13110 [Acidimicrobiales bacterium]
MQVNESAGPGLPVGVAGIRGGAPNTGLPPDMSATPRDITIRLLPIDNVAERQTRLLARTLMDGRWRAAKTSGRHTGAAAPGAQRRILVPEEVSSTM